MTSTNRPRLACVVLSVDAPECSVKAVNSLVSQSVVPEIVLVNSGEVRPFELMRPFGHRVKVLHHGGRLLPGGARNLGIAATNASHVAFLACDCTAEPEWVRLRIEAHRRYEAVSSAVCNSTPDNLAAVVSYLHLFSRRMPATEDKVWLHYGVSYARSLFEKYGYFREDLLAGEDTEFHERFASDIKIHRGRGIRTLHRHPTTVKTLIIDQHNRGIRARKALKDIGWTDMAEQLPKLTWQRVPKSFAVYWRASDFYARMRACLSFPLLIAAASAYSRGARRIEKCPRGEASTETTKPTVHALLQVKNGMRYLPGYLENIKDKVDGVIVLDDGSTDGSREFVSRCPLVKRLIVNPRREPHTWNESENRSKLIEAARAAGADWVLALDVDERLPEDFSARFKATMVRAREENIGAFTLWLRELWDRSDHYRVDGIWGGKCIARLFNLRAGNRFDRSALHGQWAPADAKRDGEYVRADLEIFHLNMIQREDRARRRKKYEELDPDHRWQSIGYGYLTDEKGCVCRKIPASSMYSPVAGGSEIDPAPPRILALLAFHDESRFLGGFLDNVAPQVDGIIALDCGSNDGSADLLEDHPKLLELLFNPRRSTDIWDDPCTRMRLLQAAARHDPDWVFVVDADERLEMHFRERANGLIWYAESKGIQELSVAVRDVWHHPDTYRVDGIWGGRRKVSLFRYRDDHGFDPRPIYSCSTTRKNGVNGEYGQSDLELYNLRMLRPEDRVLQRQHYRQIDPETRVQWGSRDYLVDETEL